MGLMINPAPTFTLNNGDIASEGKLHFFENGSTSIRKPVYIDPELSSQLNNPLTLTDAGRLPTCFGTGTYTIVLESADLVQQWVRNDITIDDMTGQFADYSSVKIYLANEIVRYVDGNYYFSLKNNNRGNSPSSNSEWWSQIGFLEFFNSSKADDNAYKLNDIVISGGFLYRSLENDNGDTPPSVKWANLTFNDSVAGNFTVGGDLIVAVDADITGRLGVSGAVQVGGDLDVDGAVTLTTALALTSGGTGAATAGDARINLGITQISGALTGATNPITSGEYRGVNIGGHIIMSVRVVTNTTPGVADLSNIFTTAIPVGWRPLTSPASAYGFNGDTGGETPRADGMFSIQTNGTMNMADFNYGSTGGSFWLTFSYTAAPL